MKLSSTQIRCLLAILSLTRMHEEVASKNVAKLLGVSRPSVHKTLDILCRDGFIDRCNNLCIIKGKQKGRCILCEDQANLLHIDAAECLDACRLRRKK